MLIYNNPANLEAQGQDLDAIYAEVGAIMEELQAKGEWVSGEALADVSQSKVVRVQDGTPAVTDGPFAEAKEHLAGFCIFDVATEERALEIAARWPDARINGVELRPLLTPGGTEM
jgi:hypothetical protein